MRVELLEQVSVSWEVIMGALDSSDIVLSISEGTLFWDDGDAASKLIELQILSDTMEEINESFMVRLYDPKKWCCTWSAQYGDDFSHR